MKRLAGFSSLAVIIATTSGCGWLWGEKGYFRDRGSDYLGARQVAPMRLPDDVQARRLDSLLPVPLNVADMQQRSGKYEVPRPQPLRSQSADSEFSLQRSGESNWIVAQHSPAGVWTMAKQFLESSGFRIAEERPQTGEILTDWQRLDELSAPLAGRLRSRISEKDKGTEMRIRVRIEPGVQRNTSEIFIVSAERPAGSRADIDFPAHSGHAGLEAALLDEMSGSLARTAEHGSAVSLLAARDFDAPSRVSLSADANGNPVLNLDTDFDRAWSGIGRALEKANVRVDDLNRSLGVYYINLAEEAKKDEEPGFFGRLFGRKPDKAEIEARAERYQVRVSRATDGVQVTVEKDVNTFAPEEVARRVLSLIQRHIG